MGLLGGETAGGGALQRDKRLAVRAEARRLILTRGTPPPLARGSEQPARPMELAIGSHKGASSVYGPRPGAGSLDIKLVFHARGFGKQAIGPASHVSWAYAGLD